MPGLLTDCEVRAECVSLKLRRNATLCMVYEERGECVYLFSASSGEKVPKCGLSGVFQLVYGDRFCMQNVSRESGHASLKLGKRANLVMV